MNRHAAIVEATGWEIEPTPWTTDAACADTNPNLWFPERGQPAGTARQICADCPVNTQCLDYALRWNIRFGIWGGHTVRERRQLRPTTTGPQRIPARHGTTTGYHRGCRCTQCREANSAYTAQQRETVR